MSEGPKQSCERLQLSHLDSLELYWRILKSQHFMVSPRAVYAIPYFLFSWFAIVPITQLYSER